MLLQENVEHKAIVVYSSPKPLGLASKLDGHFVKLPAGPASWLSTADLVGILRAERLASLS
jgi:hypothetical protein